MTTEPNKPALLTEAEWLKWMGTPQSTEAALAELRERGLIASEPVDPSLEEARAIVVDCLDKHELASEDYILQGGWYAGFRIRIALAALRRGMELEREKRLALTRGGVTDALVQAGYTNPPIAFCTALTNLLKDQLK